MENDMRPAIDICILIPCYNNVEGLIISLGSIAYHRERFVVVVVDDGSRELVTNNPLYQQAAIDVPVQVIRLQQNQGITHALNKGLDFIYSNYNSRFIARLDCGDTCAPNRFFRQVAYLELHPDIDLLGTWCYFSNTRTGEAYKYVTPTQHKFIKRSMYFRNVFIHPSVMWRVVAVSKLRYPQGYPYAEDYGLFYDIVSKKNTAILNEFLVTCEINVQGISFSNRFAQLRSRLRVIWNYGSKKWLIAAGTVKLLLLMAAPGQLVYQLKKRIFKIGAVE